jgi:hypothetical protein
MVVSFSISEERYFRVSKRGEFITMAIKYLIAVVSGTLKVFSNVDIFYVIVKNHGEIRYKRE